jgi:hypothetical protein
LRHNPSFFFGEETSKSMNQSSESFLKYGDLIFLLELKNNESQLWSGIKKNYIQHIYESSGDFVN